MSYSLFLDDERWPPHDGRQWLVARSFSFAMAIVQTHGLPSYISFDHDLGLGKTGYDFAKWLAEYCLDNDSPPDFDYYVHSQNPIGAESIRSVVDNLKRHFALHNKIV